MTLVVFDIDGTLLDSNTIDTDCYVAALLTTPGVDEIDTDWAAYRHVTDGWVTTRIFEQHLGRPPTEAEWRSVKTEMLAALDRAAARGATVDPIPGAADALAALRSRGVGVAIATGAWEVSARWKLARSGLDIGDTPAAFAEDGVARESIVQAAVERAITRDGRSFERVVSVGDGVWDVRSARALDAAFIGIADGERAARLVAAGAHTVLPHYQPVERFLDAVTGSRVPGPGPLSR